MTIGSHQRAIGKDQVRITPRSILDPLGPFDTDAAAADPRPWTCAARHVTAAMNALVMNWADFGRVWLNPPFDRRVVGEFVRLMCTHNHGILLVHVRTETEWFRPIFETATALRFLAHRYIFHKPDGSLATIDDPSSKHFGKSANSGAPIVLAAFGDRDADILSECGIDGYFVPLIFPRSVLISAIENAQTWREVVSEFLKDNGPVSCADIWMALRDHPKAKDRPHAREKIRQTLARGAGRSVARDRWVSP